MDVAILLKSSCKLTTPPPLSCGYLCSSEVSQSALDLITRRSSPSTVDDAGTMPAWWLQRLLLSCLQSLSLCLYQQTRASFCRWCSSLWRSSQKLAKLQVVFMNVLKIGHPRLPTFLIVEATLREAFLPCRHSSHCVPASQ